MSVLGLSFSYYVGNREDELALQRMSVAFERAGAELAQLGLHAFPLLGPVLEKELKGQFSAKGRGPNRGAWERLSPRYAAWKRRHHPGKPTLVLTGALRDGLTREASGRALRHWSATEFRFGTMGVPYASFHQTGTEVMPSRPPFDFGLAFEKQLQAVSLQAAREAVKKAGLDEFATLTPGTGEGTP